MLELELTYLAKEIPKDLDTSKYIDMIDIYIPKDSDHPKLRLRKQGDTLVITKKTPVSDTDASKQIEQTIKLSPEEFAALLTIPGKVIEKRRYYYKYNNHTAEIDVFQGDLLGLIVIDFEFETEAKKAAFKQPDFCLADITQEKFIAGGMLAGKRYNQIAEVLEKFDYKKLKVNF